MVEFFNPVLEVLIYYILSVKTISNLLIKFKLTGKIPLQTGNYGARVGKWVMYVAHVIQNKNKTGVGVAPCE